MIVIFPLLVSKNVNTNLVQGVAVALERYIAAYAISDFVGKQKEFNKYYNYKMKGGKIYQESDSTYFDLDPLTRGILEEQENLSEAKENMPSNKEIWAARDEEARAKAKREKDAEDETKKDRDAKIDRGAAYAKGGVQAVQWMKDAVANKPDAKGEKSTKPGFNKADISKASLTLEPTWVEVTSKDNVTSKLGIKVVPMMIEGFNIRHTMSSDMQKYFLTAFLSGVGRKVMRLVYKLLDRWTFYGQRPRGDIRQDLFYARTGHDGQPFVLLDKNEDIPKFFFSQPQHLLKLWKLSWGNLLIADDHQKTVMFCMKKYKGMCSNFSYSMIFAQVKDMAKVFEDMEDARKAVGSLFRMNKKISTLGGR